MMTGQEVTQPEERNIIHPDLTSSSEVRIMGHQVGKPSSVSRLVRSALALMLARIIAIRMLLIHLWGALCPGIWSSV